MNNYNNCEKNLPRSWDKLSYTGAKRVPLSEEPDAGSWPTFFIKRDENGNFLDDEGKPIYAGIRTPNNGIDFEGEQLERVRKVLQCLNHRRRAIARYWGAGPASKQWTPIIDRLIDTYGVSAPRAARILAAVYSAINDAFVIAWYYKYLWKVARPNQLDQELVPLLCTPEHPSYPSGHATVAGCAEVVLSYFFESEKRQLHYLAEECAVSRLYAGVHFPIDNDEGLRLGRYIGNIIVNILKKQSSISQNAIDYPILEDKEADLNPPPYRRQVIPFEYEDDCRSSSLDNKNNCKCKTLDDDKYYD
ncbi:vanadium-dependent haloperoxidase [Clostridium ganghwense]|uniref:Vanadium-dependent haloperoxidase n=1 Tax=Clostridium ganghwense TaxID=312089 RepID=A0ABT4CQI4_9CLOT|nr:vanadium-dependent haloperoxidase [Clostridium ganghwense]MCY6371314.1 vanadium-dependent haloperoxidase [Clostridium ganghwense]